MIALRVFVSARREQLFTRGSSVLILFADRHELTVAKVAQHRPDLGFIVERKSHKDRAAGCRPVVLYEFKHHFPQGAPTLRRAFAHPLDFSTIRPKPQPKHVGADLAADALSIQFADQIKKHLVGDLGKGSFHAPVRGQLSNEDRRLMNDGVDQKLNGHEKLFESTPQVPHYAGTKSSSPGRANRPVWRSEERRVGRECRTW